MNLDMSLVADASFQVKKINTLKTLKSPSRNVSCSTKVQQFLN